MTIEFEDRSGHEDGITLCVMDGGKLVHQWEIPAAEILEVAAELSAHVGQFFSSRTVDAKDVAREAMLRFAALQYVVAITAKMLPPQFREPTEVWAKNFVEKKRRCPCDRCRQAREA